MRVTEGTISLSPSDLTAYLACPHLTTLSLDDPRQWSIGWTTFPDVYTLGQSHLDEWAARPPQNLST